METLIQGNRNIKGVIAGNDTMALGAMAAFKAAGLGQGHRRRFRRQPDAIASIKAGEIKATVLQPAALIARMAVDQAHQLHHDRLDGPAGEAVHRLRAGHTRERRSVRRLRPQVRGIAHGKPHARRDHRQPRLLPRSARRRSPRDLARAVRSARHRAVMLDEHETKLGAVETWQHAQGLRGSVPQASRPHRRRARLPAELRRREGRGRYAQARRSNVPVLVQAYPDDLDQLTVPAGATRSAARSPSATTCGRTASRSSLTERAHVYIRIATSSSATCRIPRRLPRRSRACGARASAPSAPGRMRSTRRATARRSSSHGISVTTVDLSEVLDGARTARRRRPARQAEARGHHRLRPGPGVPHPKLVLMAKFGVIVLRVDDAARLDATAIQCWSSLQQNYGVNCCTIMSMMSEKLMPSACEVDVAGTVAMYALQLASGKPERAGRLEQQLRRRPRQVRVLPLRQLGEEPSCRTSRSPPRPILGTTLGEENTYGALAGRTPAGPVTFGRVTTDDRERLHPRLRRRGAVHRRCAEDLRHPCGRARARAAEADAVHLPQRLRAPRRDERLAQRRHPGRGHGHLPGLGRAPAFVAASRQKAEGIVGTRIVVVRRSTSRGARRWSI